MVSTMLQCSIARYGVLWLTTSYMAYSGATAFPRVCWCSENAILCFNFCYLFINILESALESESQESNSEIEDTSDEVESWWYGLLPLCNINLRQSWAQDLNFGMSHDLLNHIPLTNPVMWLTNPLAHDWRTLWLCWHFPSHDWRTRGCVDEPFGCVYTPLDSPMSPASPSTMDERDRCCINFDYVMTLISSLFGQRQHCWHMQYWYPAATEEGVQLNAYAVTPNMFITRTWCCSLSEAHSSSTQRLCVSFSFLFRCVQITNNNHLLNTLSFS
jgi:hypothetical protein